MNPTNTTIYSFGDFRLDPKKMVLWRHGEIEQVTPKTLEILILLVRQRDKTVSRELLMETIWPNTFVEEGNINFHISTLRKMLGQNGKAESQFIRTFPKKGYRFIGDVTESTAEESRPDEIVHDPIVAAAGSKHTGWYLISAIGVLLAATAGIVFVWQTETPGSENKINAEANRHYLRGKQILDGRAFTDESPIDHFIKAVEIDPRLTPAHLAMADAFAMQKTPEKAEATLSKVWALEPDLAGAYATHGFIRMFHYWDWAGAEAAFNRAIELDPNDAKSRHWYGVFLSIAGRRDEAMAQMRMAEELNPTSLIIASDIGQLYYFSREYDRSAGQIEQVLKINGQFTKAHLYLYEIKMAQGLESEAFDALMKSAYNPSEQIADNWRLFNEAGMRGYFLASLKQAGCLDTGDGDSFGCAIYFARLGENERALEMLEKSLDERQFLLPYVNIDPLWDGVRDDPRFRAIVEKMGIKVQK